MNKNILEELVLSLMDKALFEHTKKYWLTDVEIKNLKNEMRAAISLLDENLRPVIEKSEDV